MVPDKNCGLNQNVPIDAGTKNRAGDVLFDGENLDTDWQLLQTIKHTEKVVFESFVLVDLKLK